MSRDDFLSCAHAYRAAATTMHAGSRLTAIVAFLLIIAPLSTPAQNRNNLTSRLERAAALISDNRLAEAEQQLTNILRIAPNEALALNLLGAVRARQSRLPEAEALFLRAVRIDNNIVGVHMNLAYLYLLKGVPEKAISELKEVLRLDPDNADASNKLARLLFAQSRVDEGISLVEQLKQGSSPPTALLVALGDAYLKKNSSDKAEENYLLALNQGGDNASALLGLAQIFQGRGDDKTAALYLSRARESVASSPEHLYRLAQVAVKLNLDREALLALEKAIQLKPEEPSYLLARGVVWLRKPDLFEAEHSFRSFLKLKPNHAQGQMYLGYALLKQKKSPEACDLS